MTTSAHSASIPLSPSSSSSASNNASTPGAAGVPKLEVVNTRNPQVIRIALIGIVLLVVVALVGVLSGLSGKKKNSPGDNPMDSVLNAPGSSNLAGSSVDPSTSGSIGTPTFPPSSSPSSPYSSSPTASSSSLPLPSSSGLSTGPTPFPSTTIPDRGLLDPGHALTPMTDASRTAKPSTTALDASSAKTYVVQTGDTLWSIAQKVYGDGSKYKQLVKDNPGIAVGKLQAGTKLKVSAAAASSSTASSSSSNKPTVPAKGKTVIIKEGQTLRSIAKREYGNPGLWEVIYKANKSKIKNPSELPVGVSLVIPPKP